MTGFEVHDPIDVPLERDHDAWAAAIATDETGFTERPGSHADLERLLDEAFAGFPEGWVYRPSREHTREVLKRLFAEWKTHLTLEDRWAHCGAYRQHDEHHHKVVFNEGASRARCVGTPDLLAPAAPAPQSGPDVRKLLEDVNASTLNEWYDELREHLRGAHDNDAAWLLSDGEAVAQHFHEHRGPGGLRGHDEPANLHDFRGVNYVATVRSTEESERPDRYDEEHLRALRPDSQPLPTPSGRPSSHDRLVEALLARKDLGLRRYGSLLQAGNGRDSLRDAAEEVLDLAAYLQTWTDARDEALELLSELRADLAGGSGDAAFELRRAEQLATIRKVEHLLGGGTL